MNANGKDNAASSTSFSVWSFAVFVAAVISLLAIWWGALNQDEGWYLYAAQLVRAGQFPYGDFFFTQGPAMPFVYSVLSPLWTSWSSPLHGLLGGRFITLLFGLASTFVAIALSRRLVKPELRPAVSLSVFALLSCNLYHVYFTVIPKTYALGGFFVLASFLFLAVALESSRKAVGTLLLFASGISLAFASGTRISLGLILPVVGMSLLFSVRRTGLAFLWFGIGGAVGLFLTYGIFCLDPVSLKGLLAAQSYHAGRGGFDPLFSIGSVSRLARGYAALGIVLFASVALALASSSRGKSSGGDRSVSVMPRYILLTAFVSFLVVFLFQLSAPFPYDDYQVPLMGLLTVFISVFFVDSAQRAGVLTVGKTNAAIFVLLVSCLVSFTSPMLQEWMTYNQDRFWSQKKEMSELAKLRMMAEEINVIDPNGTELLTQDLYLAVEAGRSVPHGFEMGPFCYFPEMDDETAKSLHVLSPGLMEKTLKETSATMAACSGYAFSIGVPRCDEVSYDIQKKYFSILKNDFELIDSERNFGQNATTLMLLKRKDSGK